MLFVRGHYVVMVNNMQAREKDGESLRTNYITKGLDR